MAEENHGLEIAFRLKPTGASAIRAYTFTEGASGWEELTGFPLQDILNAQPLTAGSGYALVLGREQEPYRSYREAKEAGEEPVPFFVGLKIEGGVYDGRQLVLAWPDTYDLPPRLPEVGGSGGNEGNAGADNKGDSTEGGQRPGLDGSGGSDGRGESEGGSRNPGTEEDARQGGKGDSPGQAQDIAPDGKGDGPEAGQDPGQNGAEAPGGKGDSPETGKNPSQAGAAGSEVKGDGPEAGQDPGQDGAAAPGGKGDNPETGKNPSQTGAGGSEVKGEGLEAGQDPGQNGAEAPGGKGDSPEEGQNPDPAISGIPDGERDGTGAGQPSGKDKSTGLGGRGDSTEEGRYIGLQGTQGEEAVPRQGNISGTAGAAPAGHREERLRPDIQEKPASGAETADKGMAFPAAVGISGLICAGIMAARGAAARKIAGALRGIFLRK